MFSVKVWIPQEVAQPSDSRTVQRLNVCVHYSPINYTRFCAGRAAFCSTIAADGQVVAAGGLLQPSTLGVICD